MQLPFSHDEFLSNFGRYNSDLALPILAIWIGTVTVLVIAARRPADRAISGLLAFHWLWSGVAYHGVYFTAINPAAKLFAVLFVVQAGLFVWFGVVRRQLSFRWGSRRQKVSAVVTVVYALVYPALILLSGLRWPQMPAFAVPCPTTILTIGLLLSIEPGRNRGLAVIPLVWAGIGGSAAVLLRVIPDFALLVAGAFLLANVAWRRRFRSAPVALA